jgi:hypothetical protein
LALASRPDLSRDNVALLYLLALNGPTANNPRHGLVWINSDNLDLPEIIRGWLESEELEFMAHDKPVIGAETNLNFVISGADSLHDSFHVRRLCDRLIRGGICVEASTLQSAL